MDGCAIVPLRLAAKYYASTALEVTRNVPCPVSCLHAVVPACRKSRDGFRISCRLTSSTESLRVAYTRSHPRRAMPTCMPRAIVLARRKTRGAHLDFISVTACGAYVFPPLKLRCIPCPREPSSPSLGSGDAPVRLRRRTPFGGRYSLIFPFVKISDWAVGNVLVACCKIADMLKHFVFG